MSNCALTLPLSIPLLPSFIALEVPYWPMSLHAFLIPFLYFHKLHICWPFIGSFSKVLSSLFTCLLACLKQDHILEPGLGYILLFPTLPRLTSDSQQSSSQSLLDSRIAILKHHSYSLDMKYLPKPHELWAWCLRGLTGSWRNLSDEGTRMICSLS